MLQSVTERKRVLQRVTESYRVLQSVTECYRVILAHLLGPISGLVDVEASIKHDVQLHIVLVFIINGIPKVHRHKLTLIPLKKVYMDISIHIHGVFLHFCAKDDSSTKKSTRTVPLTVPPKKF